MLQLLALLALAPITFGSGGAFLCSVSDGEVADIVVGGVGLTTAGALAIDTGTPAGGNYVAGIRANSSGSLYGTLTTAGTDVYIQGVRVTLLGQIVYAVESPTGYANGNPVTSTGAVAVELALPSSITWDITILTFDSTVITWDRT